MKQNEIKSSDIKLVKIDVEKTLLVLSNW